MHFRTDPSREFEVVRDPLWNTIRLDATAIRIIDTPQFQRLRHIRQLGLAYLVYPGAVHTRFDHALGVYHLARMALTFLGDRGELAGVDPVDCRLAPYAALLHDVGHYPFSHALEELGEELVSSDHEELAERFLCAEPIRGTLEELAPDAPARIAAMIRGRSKSPLQGLVSGSLDLDKIEYLRRDARFCGVPYGEVDVDRLLHAIAILPDPQTGRAEVGIHEKGLSALESLLFSKYQMFRNVYWHHAVRSATAMYKRLVDDALRGGVIGAEELVGQSDERLMTILELRAAEMDDPAARRVAERWIPAVRRRRLPKRALELPAEALRGLAGDAWVASDGELRSALEDRLAGELGLDEGCVLVDYPEKPRMLGLDLLLLRRSGAVQRLTESGRAGLIGLPQVSHDLYLSARAFRVFTMERREIAPDRLMPLLAMDPQAARARLAQPEPLL
ncbi:MAG: dNTP triphosphohydrolase, broad substrate specificity [uncultured Gemmatimonadetes bacterium]|uniref:DNTP triphosphohydrolase, broad substrate specificity n=1 Tax=uncultured Gemmatimonadota bacterium TaxID=203437 RepID=A0A6J4N6M0_9BACT|nr:MAG: dNTP triphosphohydrolase, broad substrate specificity [uncultured Gemmatimonadota bacterium]